MTGLQQKLLFCRSPRRFILFYKMTRSFSAGDPKKILFPTYGKGPASKVRYNKTDDKIHQLVKIGYGAAQAYKIFYYDMEEKFKQDVYDSNYFTNLAKLPFGWLTCVFSPVNFSNLERRLMSFLRRRNRRVVQFDDLRSNE